MGEENHPRLLLLSSSKPRSRLSKHKCTKRRTLFLLEGSLYYNFDLHLCLYRRTRTFEVLRGKQNTNPEVSLDTFDDDLVSFLFSYKVVSIMTVLINPAAACLRSLACWLAGWHGTAGGTSGQAGEARFTRANRNSDFNYF